MKKRKIVSKAGDVFAVSVDAGKRGFGVVEKRALCAFFDCELSVAAPLEIDRIIASPIAFRIWTNSSALGKGLWPIVGHVPELPAVLSEEPWFFKVDPLSGVLSKYRTDEELPATLAECRELECAAVWDPVHVEPRLRDHLRGNVSASAWLQSLSVDSQLEDYRRRSIGK